MIVNVVGQLAKHGSFQQAVLEVLQSGAKDVAQGALFWPYANAESKYGLLTCRERAVLRAKNNPWTVVGRSTSNLPTSSHFVPLNALLGPNSLARTQSLLLNKAKGMCA